MSWIDTHSHLLEHIEDYTGPGGAIDHATLTDVLPDQHHLQAHTMAQHSDGPYGGAVFPTGTIVMFYGSVVPTGWALCDGLNGTPDLRDRFIVGDTAAGLGSSGGTVDPAVAQTHSVTQPGAHSDHAVTQPGNHSALTNNHVGTAVGVSGAGSSHTHAITQAAFSTTKFTTAGNGTAAYTSGGTVTTPSGAEAVHTHAAGAVTQPTAHGAISSHAGTAVDAHSAHLGTAVADHPVPFYYKLAFIMKL